MYVSFQFCLVFAILVIYLISYHIWLWPSWWFSWPFCFYKGIDPCRRTLDLVVLVLAFVYANPALCSVVALQWLLWGRPHLSRDKPFGVNGHPPTTPSQKPTTSKLTTKPNPFLGFRRVLPGPLRPETAFFGDFFQKYRFYHSSNILVYLPVCFILRCKIPQVKYFSDIIMKIFISSSSYWIKHL